MSDEAPTSEIIPAEVVHGDLMSDDTIEQSDDVPDVPDTAATEAATEAPDSIGQHAEDTHSL
jgi:hypothetical protein